MICSTWDAITFAICACERSGIEADGLAKQLGEDGLADDQHDEATTTLLASVQKEYSRDAHDAALKLCKLRNLLDRLEKTGVKLP